MRLSGVGTYTWNNATYFPPPPAQPIFLQAAFDIAKIDIKLNRMKQQALL